MYGQRGLLVSAAVMLRGGFALTDGGHEHRFEYAG